MKKSLVLLLLLFLCCTVPALAEPMQVWSLVTSTGTYLTHIAEEPSVGDCYISAENRLYEVISVAEGQAIADEKGSVTLPSLNWLEVDAVLPVSAVQRRIALYCTHSDESYEPTDGHYSTNGRGSIYDIARSLASNLSENGISATLSDNLHHPHDAGAYRRSRQTAIQLLNAGTPDCLLDIHRDGIPDPDSYAVTIGGKAASKIRLLVGRGNQNAELNKEFALLVKAVGDRVYPGLIKDIYMGKGTFNQDLLPRSLLLECGTYTLDKERVLTSMPMMADVLQRALYGGVVGSAGRTVTDTRNTAESTGGITQGEPDPQTAPEMQQPPAEQGVGSGLVFVLGILVVGLIGYAILSTGSVRGGMHKAGRNLSEMTGGLLGKKPNDPEDPEHS